MFEWPVRWSFKTGSTVSLLPVSDCVIPAAGAVLVCVLGRPGYPVLCGPGNRTPYLSTLSGQSAYSSPSLIRPPYLPRNCVHNREVTFGGGREVQ